MKGEGKSERERRCNEAAREGRNAGRKEGANYEENEKIEQGCQNKVLMNKRKKRRDEEKLKSEEKENRQRPVTRDNHLPTYISSRVLVFFHCMSLSQFRKNE